MINIENYNGITVISLYQVSRLTVDVSEKIKTDTSGIFQHEGSHIILSMKGVRFIDSSGFGMLIHLMKKAKNNFGSFKISDVAPDLMDLLKLLQLHTIFEIYPSLEDCLKSYSTD